MITVGARLFNELNPDRYVNRKHVFQLVVDKMGGESKTNRSELKSGK